jgi:hypothetical protein
MLSDGHMGTQKLIDYSLPPGSFSLHSLSHRRQVSVLNEADESRRISSPLAYWGNAFSISN